MIRGIGCDIINIERLRQETGFLERFANRILGSEEVIELKDMPIADNRKLACELAKYYAGKEAFVKALGTGFRDGIFFRDIQILHDDLGKPELKISGRAAEYLKKLSAAGRSFITLSDDYPYAQAVVIIEE